MHTSDPPFGVTHLVVPTDGTPESWWSNYVAQLREIGVPATSRQVIEADAQFIVDQGVRGAGPPGSPQWPDSRARSGVVMGAVQSGKTASMLAVIAKALDSGVNAVVVLAGTRVALWQQTFSRLASQLDTWESPWARRLLVPNKTVLQRNTSSLDLSSLYALPSPQTKSAVAKGIPILAVVMKNAFHLERMALTLHRSVYPAAAQQGEPFHLLVIDDEADDSSILDAVSETRAGISPAETKQVPRRIADLWEARTRPGETSHEVLYATYVAYTATPQANFLQEDSNPLAPRDFAMSLRTPGPIGQVEPRSTTYTEPAGAKSWYTGGDIFYRTLASVPLCRTEDPREDVFGNAIRCFLVGSAVRLWREPIKLGPSSAAAASFATNTEAREGLASPASMLIHPSFSKDDHFDVAAEILSWADGADQVDARARIIRGERGLSVDGVREQIDAEPEKWLYWIREFAEGAQRCLTPLMLPVKPPVPTIDDWPEVRRLILDEVVPGTRIAVINSDESADDRPDFEVRKTDGGWGAPPNHSTIFVSGNVMARGLTLEGLTTTLFTRRSDTPLADTQMQMQRWFGYRGKFLELCRVFLAKPQLDLFRAYHEADEALRRDILALMNEPDGSSRAVTVLQGRRFAATGKIANVSGASIWPGATPFIRHMNAPDDDEPNAKVVADLLSQGIEAVRAKDGRDLGLLLTQNLDLLATAELLDGLTYADHGPGANGAEAQRWRSLANNIGLTPGEAEHPLYRAPSGGLSVNLGHGSPYAIAAYLRAWSACLTRRAPGLTTTDPPHGPWSLVDLLQRSTAQPTFRVGIRFGRGSVVRSGPLAHTGHEIRLMNREVTPEGDLAASWGSRGQAGRRNSPANAADRYPGDEYFDYFAHGEAVPEKARISGRPFGEPGMLLFYPVARGEGRFSLAVGVSIPLGGPDQIAAVISEERP